MLKFSATILLILLSQMAFSQTYTFNGNGNWSDSANWMGRLIPPTSTNISSIIIDPVSNGECIVNKVIYIRTNSILTVMPNAKMRVLGNLIINDQVTGDSTLLSEYVQINTPIGDSVLRYLFTYDSLNRLSKFESFIYNSDQPNSPAHQIFSYSYYLNDTLPFMATIYSSPYYNVVFNTEHYYKYNNTGKMIYDSTTNLVQKTYYLSNKILDSNTAYNRSIYFSSLNGNVVSQKDTLGQNTLNNFSYHNDTYAYTYDNTFNPFYKFSFMYPSYYGYDNDWTLVYTFKNVTKQKNNPLQLTFKGETYFQTINIHNIYSYQLRPDNYPKTVTINDVSNNRIMKGYYYYTH